MLLVLGDLHFKEKLSYADFIADGREQEKKNILDFIVDQSKKCTKIIFLGDGLNSRTNPPSVITEFTNFIERFDDKEIYILSGNHEQFASGKSSIDYLKEIKNKKNWHIITDDTVVLDNLSFCPFFTKAQLNTNNNEECVKEIMKKLKPGNILFAHHAISDCIAGSGHEVDNFPEPVLPRNVLEKKYKLVIAGHIHQPQIRNRTIITGSVFTAEIGELEKFIFKVDPTDFTYEQIKLPCRPIYKLEIFSEKAPQIDWGKFDKNGIIKAIIKEKKTTVEMYGFKEELSKFAAYVLLEQVPHERKKLHYGEGEALLSFNIEQLLEVYAKERDVSFDLLKRGFDLVRA